MTRQLRLCPLLILGLLASSCTTPPPAPAGDGVIILEDHQPTRPRASRNSARDGPLILISLDGFRWDYLQRFEAPTLRQLAAAGTRLRSLTPSYPTKTFPNHYTLVTGLRPARHGIVGNWFYDAATGETFGMKKPESNNTERWWGGEPVWITAEKQGVRSACYFWPGSEVAHGGVRPTHWLPFDDNVPSPDRVDGLLRWLDTPPAGRPRLLTLYFSAVDHAGHKFGPDDPALQASITEVDQAVARLLAGLERLGLRESTNLVIVSDHGMSPVSPERVIFLEDLVDIATIEIEMTGVYAGVRPKPGTRPAAALAAAIRAKAPAQLKVYERGQMPARFHFDGTDRISAVMLVPDDQWCIEQKTGWPARAANYQKGNHGWDPATSNMGALFLASGPAFRRGVELPAMDNIHVYPLLCQLLGLTPVPNDGDDRLARAVLRR